MIAGSWVFRCILFVVAAGVGVDVVVLVIVPCDRVHVLSGMCTGMVCIAGIGRAGAIAVLHRTGSHQVRVGGICSN